MSIPSKDVWLTCAKHEEGTCSNVQEHPYFDNQDLRASELMRSHQALSRILERIPYQQHFREAADLGKEIGDSK